MEKRKDTNTSDSSSCDNNYSSHSELEVSPPYCKENLRKCKVLLKKEQVPPHSQARKSKRKQVQEEPHTKRACLRNTHNKVVSGNNEDDDDDFVANTKSFTKPHCKKSTSDVQVMNTDDHSHSHLRKTMRKRQVQEEPHTKRVCLRNTRNKQVSGKNEDDFIANTKSVTKSQSKKSTSDIQEINADDQQKCRKVYFDLETTSLFVDCDIIQIGATDEKEDYSIYIIPTQSIDPRASAVTGLTFKRGSLMYKGQPVEAHPRRKALQCFLEWIEKRTPVILFAHNATFDYTRFFHAITEEDLVEDFRKHIVGFVNTIPVFKEKFPGLPKYNLTVLVDNLLKKDFNAHNALGDVHVLKELCYKANVDVVSKGSITFSSAYEKFEKQKHKRAAAKFGSKFRKFLR